MDGLAVLRIQEPVLDLSNVAELRDLLEEKTRAHGGALVLDLSAASYVGSVGLGAISMAAIQMSKGGRRFGILVGTDEVRRIFRVSGLPKVIPVGDTIDELRARLRP